MKDFEISEFRALTKRMYPSVEMEASLTFYYDETNNIKKFYVRENDFNTTFASNFVLGGLVHEGDPPDVQGLIDSFNLQKTAHEVKFRHIAKGDFLNCIKSKKLRLFLNFINDSKLYIHYSSLNILYWSLADIIDSVVVNSSASEVLHGEYSNLLKSTLYKVAKLEIGPIINLFHRFEYPNIKEEKITSFIDGLISIFESYIVLEEFHFALESLRQLLKEAQKRESLPFLEDEEDHVLINNLLMVFLRPIYIFKNSAHIFDNEDSIVKMSGNLRILDGTELIQNYSFVDSKSNQLVQLSDVFVGLMGKLTKYLNSNGIEKIDLDFDSLSGIQKENIDLLIEVINKSNNKNIFFLHSIDSMEELGKWRFIEEKRGKYIS